MLRRRHRAKRLCNKNAQRSGVMTRRGQMLHAANTHMYTVSTDGCDCSSCPVVFDLSLPMSLWIQRSSALRGALLMMMSSHRPCAARCSERRVHWCDPCPVQGLYNELDYTGAASETAQRSGWHKGWDSFQEIAHTCVIQKQTQNNTAAEMAQHIFGHARGSAVQSRALCRAAI